VNPHMDIFWVPTVLFVVAGALLLLLPGEPADPLKRRNRRTAGVLFLAAGAAFGLVASGALSAIL